MIEKKSGRIINISSQSRNCNAARRGDLLHEQGRHQPFDTLPSPPSGRSSGITVNTVSPTFIWTDSTRPVLADQDFYDRTVGHIPLGRIGDTDDVVGAVVYLASPAAALVTGANLLVDRGWSVRDTVLDANLCLRTGIWYFVRGGGGGGIIACTDSKGLLAFPNSS